VSFALAVLEWNLIRQTKLIEDDYHLPEDDNHHSHRRGNLKSYKLIEDGPLIKTCSGSETNKIDRTIDVLCVF
jgi:hypothetical protein